MASYAVNFFIIESVNLDLVTGPVIVNLADIPVLPAARAQKSSCNG